MTEFVENKGKDLKQEPNPIKKTLTHQEFKKILQQEMQEQQKKNENFIDPNFESDPRLTPAQKMKMRKELQAREQQEKLNQAAREAHLTKDQHKQKKLEQFQGKNTASPPKSTTAFSQNDSSYQSKSTFQTNYTAQQASYYQQTAGGYQQGNIIQDYEKLQMGGGVGQSAYGGIAQANVGGGTLKNDSHVS